MLPVQQMFGGGAMNPTAGMAMNPLLQGFGSYQNMQDQFTNTGLNQQSQDIANQAAQHALEQEKLGDPLLAAQRQTQLGQQGIEQTQIDSGQALALRQAQDQAKKSAAFTNMSNDEVTKAENVRSAVTDVAQNMQDPSYAMNPANWKVDRQHLIDAGAKEDHLPETYDPVFGQKFISRAATAANDLKTIRASKVAQVAQESKMAYGKQVGEYQVKAAEAGMKKALMIQSNLLPDDVKVMKAASDEFQSNGGVLSSDTYSQVIKVLDDANRKDPQLQKAAETATSKLDGYSPEDLKTQAAKPPYSVDTTKYTERGAILTEAQQNLSEQLITQRTMNQLRQRFPGAKVQQPDGSVQAVAGPTATAAPGVAKAPTLAAPTSGPVGTGTMPATTPEGSSLTQPRTQADVNNLQAAAGADLNPNKRPAYSDNAWKAAKTGAEFFDPVTKQIWRKK